MADPFLTDALSDRRSVGGKSAVPTSQKQKQDKQLSAEQQKWKEDAKRKEKEKTNVKKPEKKKRKYSYRKTTELEEEIFARETRILSLNEDLLIPQVVRDPNRAKEIHLEIAEEQQKLAALYEHWEEASELNWG
jgi:hypothetical protein